MRHAAVKVCQPADVMASCFCCDNEIFLVTKRRFRRANSGAAAARRICGRRRRRCSSSSRTSGSGAGRRSHRGSVDHPLLNYQTKLDDFAPQMTIKVKQIKAELGALFCFKRKTELRRRLKAIKVSKGELNTYLRKKWARMVSTRTPQRLSSSRPCQRGRFQAQRTLSRRPW